MRNGFFAAAAAFSAVAAFLRDARLEAMRAYKPQYGLFLALPVTWGCLDAFVFSWFAPLGFLAMAAFLEGRAPRRLAMQTLIFAAWCAWLGTFHPHPVSGGESAAGLEVAAQPAVELTGEVQGFPSRKNGCALVLAAKAGSFKVQADTCPFAPAPGQRVKAMGRMAPPAPPTNPGQFDYPALLLSQGLDGVLRADSLVLLGPPGPIQRLVAAARGALQAGLARTLPEAERPLLEAALLGRMDGLDTGVMDDFRASGMLHILAISGQHIGILAMMMLQLLSLLRLPRKAAFLATAVLLTLYVPVSGSSISVIRSAVMFGCGLPGVLLERPALSLNSLGLAATVCLLWMPYQILSLGFQLSFAATFFLVLYSRPLARFLAYYGIRHPLLVYLVSTTAMSLGIFLGVFPILAAATHCIAPSSIAGNLATVGLSSGMLVAACLALMAAPFPGGAGSWLGETAAFHARLLLGAVHALARWPGSNVAVPALPLAGAVGLLFLLLAFPAAARRGRALTALLLGLGAWAGAWAGRQAWAAWQAPAEVTFLDVGQGDAAVCRLPGSVILVDAGPPRAGRDVIVPFLRQDGINRVDLVILTHPDLDHYGGLAEMLPGLRIGKVVYPGLEADTRAWRELKDKLAANGIPLEAVRRGQALYRDQDQSLAVLSPERPGQFPGRNDNSVVCRLRLRRSGILFTGDMELAAQDWLLAQGAGEFAGDILKVPHHGSDKSNGRVFLEALRPRIAVLSAGRRNRFGHPGPATVRTLDKLGSDIYLTARQGAISLTSRRKGETWSTYLRPAGSRGPINVN